MFGSEQFGGLVQPIRSATATALRAVAVEILAARQREFQDPGRGAKTIGDRTRASPRMLTISLASSEDSPASGARADRAGFSHRFGLRGEILARCLTRKF